MNVLFDVNIFVTDLDPKIAAINLCDIHVPKMILESTQMLSNAFHKNHPDIAPCSRSYVNHPCSKWVLEAKGNFLWLLEHLIEMNAEYTKRFKKIHAWDSKVKFLSSNYNILDFDTLYMTPHVQVMPLIYRGPDTVEAYRKYIRLGKSFVKWNHGTPAPSWFSNKVI